MTLEQECFRRSPPKEAGDQARDPRPRLVSAHISVRRRVFPSGVSEEIDADNGRT